MFHLLFQEGELNNTTYDMYEHDISASNPTTSNATNLYEHTFFFSTTENKVYKVLDNNGGTAYSGAEPTTTSTTPFELGGYTLQYMYSLTTSQIQKVSYDRLYARETTDSTVSAAAVDGAIDIVRVTGGSGYTNGTYFSPVDGDGTGGIVQIEVSGGDIVGQGSSGSNMFANGTGYTFATVNLADVYSDNSLNTSILVLELVVLFNQLFHQRVDMVLMQYQN